MSCCNNSSQLPIGPPGPAGSSANDAWLLLGNAATVAGTNFIGTTDTVDFVVKTDNTERIRVDSVGNIGFNNPAPDYFLDGILDINDYCAFELYNPNTGTSAASRVYLNSPLGATALEQYNQNWITSTFRFQNGSALISTGTGGLSIVTSNVSGDIRFYTGGSTQKAILTSAGKFGIGATPTAYLDVLGTTEQVRVRYDSSNYYTTTVGSTGSVTYDAVGSGAAFIYNDKVGIGMTPNYALTISATGVSEGFRVKTGTNSNFLVRSTGTDEADITMQDSTGTSVVNISTIASNVSFIKNSYFGLGTVTPSHRLTVTGASNLDGILVRNNGGSVNGFWARPVGTDDMNLLVQNETTTVAFQIDTRLAVDSYLVGTNFGIGTTTPNTSALVDLTSTTQGLLLPRMTATQGGAITGVDGLVIYVTNTNGTFTSVGFWGYENSAWVKL